MLLFYFHNKIQNYLTKKIEQVDLLNQKIHKKVLTKHFFITLLYTLRLLVDLEIIRFVYLFKLLY